MEASMGERAAKVSNEPSMADLREEIDQIDEQLLHLLNRRTELALTIGRIKHGQQLPVYVPERERLILARLEALNTGPLPNDSIGHIFGAIIMQMRELEERLRN
jgi:chorismate mutase/prephenate dehydratase